MPANSTHADYDPISILVPFLGTFLDADVIPKAITDATCEMARELLLTDRTAAPPGEGIASVHTGHTDAAGSGATGTSDNSTTVYSKDDKRPIISHVAQAMLAKFGALVRGGSGAVRLVRV